MLARRLGLDAEVIVALEHAYERWDGTGDPAGLEGDEIPLETRIAVVARDADLFARHGDSSRRDPAGASWERPMTPRSWT